MALADCVNYRQINKKLIKDRYPLIEDQLASLQAAKVFSTLDLRNGFFHVPVERESQKYTAFVVPDAHYEFLRVPFGLCNSPTVFQKYVNVIFRDMIAAKTVLVYMDDVIIPSIYIVSELRALRDVLNIASQRGLFINWKKCQFLQPRVEYLGHVICDGFIYLSECKTKAVMKFARPRNIKQVQSFLGLTGYFRKFIPQYSKIAQPLTDLLRADARFIFGVKEI